jgi:GxxExxY protein
MLIDDELDGLSEQVIGGAIGIHKTYGPGLLENAYRPPFVVELKAMGLRVEVDKPLPLVHNGVRVNCAYRIDILVEGKLLVELKSVERILPIQITQVKTYLKLGDFKVGLLMNFNVEYMRYGIRRVLHPDLASKIPKAALTQRSKPPSPKSTAGFE